MRKKKVENIFVELIPQSALAEGRRGKTRYRWKGLQEAIVMTALVMLRLERVVQVSQPGKTLGNQLFEAHKAYKNETIMDQQSMKRFRQVVREFLKYSDPITGALLVGNNIDFELDVRQRCMYVIFPKVAGEGFIHIPLSRSFLVPIVEKYQEVTSLIDDFNDERDTLYEIVQVDGLYNLIGDEDHYNPDQLFLRGSGKLCVRHVNKEVNSSNV